MICWPTIVCIASGPSLTDEDCAHVERARALRLCRVVVVNDNWRKLPNADLLYACDPTWWDRYIAEVSGGGFAGELWTQDGPSAERYGLHHVKLDRSAEGLSRKPGVINSGQNGGYQAINLAYHCGAKAIVLLGYDLQVAPDGKHHWFGNHPREFTNGNPAGWVAGFTPLARDLAGEGVRVLNATRRTALTCFARVSIAEALPLPILEPAE